MGSQSRDFHLPCAGLCASLSNYYSLSLDVIMFTQSVRLPKGKLGKRSGYLLVSYFHFYFFDLWGEKQQVRQNLLWSKKLKGVLGLVWVDPGGAWFKVRQKNASGRDLLPKIKKKKKKKVFPAKSLSQSHQKTEEVEEERMEGK